MKPQIFTARRAVSAVAALAVSGALTVAAMPAEAFAAPGHVTAAATKGKPVKLGLVTNLKASTTVQVGPVFTVHAAWDALSGATSYSVTVTNSAGTAIETGKTTTNKWDAQVQAKAGASLTVTVTPVSSTGRSGRTASKAFSLPFDTKAPTGSFTATHEAGNEAAVAVSGSTIDDFDVPSNVTQEIKWADAGDTWESDAQYTPFTGDQVTHIYSHDGVYHATVRLTDQSKNVAVMPVTITVNDHVAPAGSFTVAPATGFAKLTKVSLSEVSVTDNFSKSSDVTRLVNWGDNTTPVAWTPGTAMTHVYTTGGSFTPSVILTDEAGNASSPVETSKVTVTVDSAAPIVRVKKPRHARQVLAWRTVRGTARDGLGVGVARVRVKAVEKRGTAWYVYRPAAHTWAKTHLGKRGALRKARVTVLRAGSTGAWSMRLARLRKGTLVLNAVGRDKVGNVSRAVVVQQSLTR